MTDPIEDIIGDYRAFAAQQRDRLLARGIDIAPYALSHLAFRVPEWDEYVHVRTQLERHATSNRENFWNGRPISCLALMEPLEVLAGKVVRDIRLTPPVHQRVYKMGLEHLGVVVGDGFDAFSREHRSALAGQQFRSIAATTATRNQEESRVRRRPQHFAEDGVTSQEVREPRRLRRGSENRVQRATADVAVDHDGAIATVSEGHGEVRRDERLAITGAGAGHRQHHGADAVERRANRE
jgi:predicted metalloenzyme YecM